MSPRLRNPLRGSWHPLALSKRITNFLLLGGVMLFVGTNRRIFNRIVGRQTGLRDPRTLPNTPRRTAFSLCFLGTLFLFLSVVFLFASSWSVMWAAAAALTCYLLAGLVLSRILWGLPVAFRGRGHGRLAEILRRTWQVIRHGAP